jgi:hypothetical protein
MIGMQQLKLNSTSDDGIPTILPLDQEDERSSNSVMRTVSMAEGGNEIGLTE